MKESTGTVGQASSPLGQDPSTVADAALKFWERTQKAHWHLVDGVSMWPFLKRGDKVLVSPEIDHLAVGDVVVFRLNQKALVHRITQLSQHERITTWGDFNLRPDSSVARSQIVGKVVRIERSGQNINLGKWRTGWGKAILIGRPVVLPLVSLIRRLNQIKKRLKL